MRFWKSKEDRQRESALKAEAKRLADEAEAKKPRFFGTIKSSTPMFDNVGYGPNFCGYQYEIDSGGVIFYFRRYDWGNYYVRPTPDFGNGYIVSFKLSDTEPYDVRVELDKMNLPKSIEQVKVVK